MTRPSPVKGDAEARASRARTQRAAELPTAEELAESIVFRWYTLAQEEHDMLSREGLEALRQAIAGVLIQEGVARSWGLSPKPARRKAK